MKRILLVIGTRPEAIKMAPVYKELHQRTESFQTLLCSTGQHSSMLSSMLSLFDLRPDCSLSVLRPGQSLPALSARILLGMSRTLEEQRPDLVLVHGDTSTSTFAALASFYAHIPVGHVEAGLRTGRADNPFPEEMNRRLNAHLCRFHFVPTEEARQNLLREGIKPEDIVLTGNTVIDALQWVLHSGRCTHPPLGLDEGRRLVLLTAHRRENLGTGLSGICRAMNRLAHLFPDTDFVYPLHPNPVLRQTASAEIDTTLPNVFLPDALPYEQMVYLLKRSTIVLTDSGGLQEEATALGRPLLVLRESTERPEAILAGSAALVGTKEEDIVCRASALLSDAASLEQMAHSICPFGDGHAAKRIADFLQNTEWATAK